MDSLKDYTGIVGIMGGEPTLHPMFSDFIKYYAERRKDSHFKTVFKRPSRDFNHFHSENLNSITSSCRRGLWSALGNKYYEYFEQIQDIFPYQCINDHRNVGMHRALLISRKELCIPDDEWIELRNNCWIQNEWSASITPKGAFFCEVAAALDMLFDGPGGWPIEPGWWKRTPEQFCEQLKWCELCSAALAVPSNPGNEEMDIISPMLKEKIEKQGGSFKLEHQRYHLFDVEKYKEEKKKFRINYSPVPYISSEEKRVSQDTSSSLYPKDIAVFGEISFDVSKVSTLTQISLQELRGLNFSDWCLYIKKGSPMQRTLIENIKTLIFNPGICYYDPDESFYFFNRNASSLINSKNISEKKILEMFQPKKRYCWRNWSNPDVPAFLEYPAILTEKVIRKVYNGYAIISAYIKNKIGPRVKTFKMLCKIDRKN